MNFLQTGVGRTVEAFYGCFDFFIQACERLVFPRNPQVFEAFFRAKLFRGGELSNFDMFMRNIGLPMQILPSEGGFPLFTNFKTNICSFGRDVKNGKHLSFSFPEVNLRDG